MNFNMKKTIITAIFVCFVNIIYIFFCVKNANASSNLNMPAVVGDSYAGKMAEVDPEFRFKYFVFPVPGIEQQPNVELFNQCLNDEDVRYILYTTSVNDQGRLLSPEIFKKFLYAYAEIAKEKNKFLFFHTYMNVPHPHIQQVQYKSIEYDNVLREIADAYNNVFYIDMNYFDDNRYILSDKSHFNRLFHETLKAKYLEYVYDLNKNMYGINSPYDAINDANMIYVTGDSYAGSFYLYENNKKYNMIEMAVPNRTIFENEYLIQGSLMSLSKYVLLSTSVNDFRMQTDIRRFEDEIRRFANLATINSKILFLHTYMNYVYYEDKTATDSEIKKYNIEDYDNSLKKIADEYDKVIYIDMSEYNDTRFMMADLIHYGPEFNDALYNKIDQVIRKF